ncbi:Multifunctional CCA protein [Candidatus Erwinia haradaeae]|uniref:CCA-adding enzyme n=1 Tax=Candidatus Erwinia haradaeae TaxID=1922217 RepID=A0A451DCN1_9GAMM|nr:multifunctional CCA addition/repair protein [Candidatus Erwinia haradaeae]VFP84208.1 Multifunctional CCA protein [Candidatus Erwinia haradaeae]
MEIYLVGGAVRDKLLNLPLKDRDWVVVGGSPQTMLDLGYQKVGRHFPVFLHPKTHEEYALARTERKEGHGYSGFVCYYAPDVTLKQDLARRDLTINAIAQDQYGMYYDPYGGFVDLHQRQLRHISPSFNEDPLRVLRVARFSAYFAHLNFHIADETLKIMKGMVHSGELQFLTAPRIWKEIESALQTNHPHIFFKALYDCGAFKALFPELDSIMNVFNISIDQVLTTFSGISKHSANLAIRFAAFFYSFRHALMSQIHLYTPHGKYDALLNFKTIAKLCQRLHAPRALRDLALLVMEFYDTIQNIQHASPEQLIYFFNQIDAWRKPLRIEQISIILDADFGACSSSKHGANIKSAYLCNAWKVVNSISVQEVIDSGFIGRHIGDELSRRQSIVLNDWQHYSKEAD